MGLNNTIFSMNIYHYVEDYTYTVTMETYNKDMTEKSWSEYKCKTFDEVMATILAITMKEDIK